MNQIYFDFNTRKLEQQEIKIGIGKVHLICLIFLRMKKVVKVEEKNRRMNKEAIPTLTYKHKLNDLNGKNMLSF